jgi:O-antigen ligase
LIELPDQLTSHIAKVPITVILLTHLALGLLVFLSRSIVTPYAYVTIVGGVLLAIAKPPIFGAYAAAYVIGSEVLWRMTSASVFYEMGKYAVILILGVSLIHHRRRRIPVTPLFFMLLLLPSIVLTLDSLPLDEAREQISFNLSGPLALFVSAWFFSGITIRKHELQGILTAMIGPMLTTAVYALLLTATAQEIQWGTESMFVTSGGFGPNQVSTVMGLGLVAVWLLIMLGGLARRDLILLVVAAAAIGLQALLTFSRGGIVAAVLVLAFSSLHFIRNKQQRVRLLLVLLVGVPLLINEVIPRLDEFTNNTFSTRFSDTDLSGRDVILEEELTLFAENPVAGVGVGMGNTYRGGIAAHTEYTRLLGEHGILGAVALLLLIGMAAKRYFSAKDSTARGVIGSFLLWPLVVMTNAAMRIAAISFTFGLAFAEYELDD